MRTAPAQPTQDTDQESSWCRGTVWSLASKARTDWWKTSTQRSTKTPGGQPQSVSVKIISTLKVWCVCCGLTGENEADRCRLQEEENLFAERHGDAYRPHDHQEQAEERQHGCRHIQVCTEEVNWFRVRRLGDCRYLRVAQSRFNSLDERLLVKHHWEIFSRISFLPFLGEWWRWFFDEFKS